MDSTIVYFTGIDRGFTVSSILAQFNLFGHDITIRWYGAIIAFGFLLAVLFGGRTAYKWKMNLDKMIDVLIYSTLAAIIGARLYYCFFYDWESYRSDPLSILYIWNGGLAIYGGIIFGIAAAYVVCRVRKLNFWNLLDCVGMSLLIGQGIGRWGNFTNQEAFGTNTDLPWGMWSKKIAETILQEQETLAQKGISVDANLPVHPTFLYESIWCLTGFVVLYIITKKARRFSGQTFLCYGLWYGVGRMIIEGFRTDSLYIGSSSIRVSQLMSAVVAATCLVLLIVLTSKYKKHPKPIDGIDYFMEEELLKQEEALLQESDDNEDAEELTQEDTENEQETVPKLSE
ncbi:MAG: prolipoprotein diacylglyceryl transferase [Clostridia bacterium]|nr:prolipoprotein diacylglyceryl transferase [Clostridia bacterium]